MSAYLKFREHQLAIDLDIEDPSVAGDQAQVDDVVLEFSEQLSGRAHGAVGVVSGQAVGDGDLVFGHVRSRGAGVYGIFADRPGFCLFATGRPSVEHPRRPEAIDDVPLREQDIGCPAVRVTGIEADLDQEFLALIEAGLASDIAACGVGQIGGEVQRIYT
jgi:hypothetical protein